MTELNVGATAPAQIPWPPLDLDPDPEEFYKLLTEDDLPDEDGVPMESDRHRKQMYLLLEILELYLSEDWYVSGNMFVYFSPRQVKNEYFRGPDFFAVRGVPRRLRKSYVVWQEGKAPDIIIELLSDKTRVFDKNGKKQTYQDMLRVPEYFWYDPISQEWAGFELRDSQYQPVKPDEEGRLISKQLGLALVRREGTYQNMGGTWLRFETLDGHLLPSAEEMAIAAQDEADTARLAAKAARREAEAAQQEAEVAQQEKLNAQQEAEVAQQEKLNAQREAEAAQREAEAAQQEKLNAQREAEAAQREKLNAQQQAAELQALLEKYKTQFGELPK